MLPKQFEPTYCGYQPTKFEPKPPIALACILGYISFAVVCAIARGTCLVQVIGPNLVPSSFRHSSATNEYSPVPIATAVRAPDARKLGQTDI